MNRAERRYRNVKVARRRWLTRKGSIGLRDSIGVPGRFRKWSGTTRAHRRRHGGGAYFWVRKAKAHAETVQTYRRNG